ncbi:MAG: TM1802 family CRISPR-associated protein, partial [Thermotogota bacterium]|nr:TM1802 family CRISPR-associated protein [Thermotogota bacterium]
KKRITKAKKEYDKLKEIKNWDNMLLILCRKIVVVESGNYWIWLSINGKTFYELMPEVRSNWYKNPVSAGDSDNLQKGYDSFTNSETEIGYKPDVKVFSYDQYHDSMEYRLNENLPLSLESAKNIKFAWMYILNNLVFYYKGLEYVLIPNLIVDNIDLYKTVLNRFRRANKNSNTKKSTLEQFNAREKRLEKDIKKLKTTNNENLNELIQQREETLSKIKELDTGMIREFDEQLNEVGDIKNSITIDYIFTSINRTNLSFEIKGSIEDVIPSQVRNVVAEMAKPGHIISDLVKLGKRDRSETLLQDFFNREELSFVLNRSQKNNANKILQERLYLARLLLTDTKIEIDQLLQRFETNRLLGYDKKKRLTRDGTYEWIEFPKSFTTNEDNIYNFFKRLGKIKG